MRCGEVESLTLGFAAAGDSATGGGTLPRVILGEGATGNDAVCTGGVGYTAGNGGGAMLPLPEDVGRVCTRGLVGCGGAREAVTSSRGRTGGSSMGDFGGDRVDW